ncbi:hypothetical protein PENTCL1PPCAC_10275, partial [Pristionchus entomophagus]
IAKMLLVASLLLSVCIHSSWAQTCGVTPTGPCIGGNCPAPTDTCLTQMCCPTASIVTTTTTTTAAPSTTTAPAATTCVDLLNPRTGVSDCPATAYLCNNAAYYTLMTQQCPRTCSRCSGAVVPITTTTTTNTKCVDLLNPSTGVSDCPSRVSLCNNAAYYTLMTQQCPRTCGRCSVGK